MKVSDFFASYLNVGFSFECRHVSIIGSDVDTIILQFYSSDSVLESSYKGKKNEIFLNF